ncbi:hypothetical protein [Tropicibacter oceani]|uniref:Uncharacterized protein n=1 Tax=Tropicibacter oceani TaxID=3058420 RepID=A0ABY8QIG9_9RHOB|nr:hypothetical protein [Tropicibacter oceani]WGW04432.1 hypothetical protein QF118_02485 [Tropicibacter oceani]
MLLGLALPVVILLILSVLVTRGVEALMPESMAGIVATLIVSALLMWGIAAGLFAGLYLWRGVTVAAVFGAPEGWRHFLWLGGRAALIWAPLVLLVVVTAPRRWKETVW